MRRSVFTRLTALVVGLWFVAMSAAPEVMHACPTHGAHAGVASSSDSGHTSATVAPAEHHQLSDEQSPRQHGDQCTCLGRCCGATSVALVASSISLADSVTAATRDAGLPDHAYVPVAAEHVLPPAQAPPLSA